MFTTPKTTDRNDRLAEVHEQLAAGIEALVSGDGWQAMLAMRARLHRYSFNNLILVLTQMPTATMVAGYKDWTKMGRQVRKGEHGLKVLAPCTYPAKSRDGEEVDESRRVVRGFKAVSVFDISQTDGPELEDVAPVLLDGEAPAGAWDAIVSYIESAGYTVERGECCGANGWTNYATRTVRVRGDVTEAQADKSGVHEAAHVALHEHELGGCRGRVEVEAESIAYLVCSELGLDTDGYSFPYVAGWSGGDADVVRATADRVIGAAGRILADVAGSCGGVVAVAA